MNTANAHVRKIVKRILERALSAKIVRLPPHGANAFWDLDRLHLAERIETIVDVGANVGQSAILFASELPNSKIFCLEPVCSTYLSLVRNTGPLDSVRCFQVGLSSTNGDAVMRIDRKSEASAIVEWSEVSPNEHPLTEIVTVTTLDSFCKANEIFAIDWLKIDTEGWDLECLKGGIRMLGEGNVGLIQVEAGMNPCNKKHVPFQEFAEFLAPFGFCLLGVYDQQLEWDGQARLRYSNPIFISEAYFSS